MSQPGFVAHCLELLAPLGAARARRMFGGHGLYLDDLFIGIVADERLFLKADAEGAERFRSCGGEVFSYEREGRRAELGFWTPPAEALESPDAMGPWARLALRAALAARASAPSRRRTRSSPAAPSQRRTRSNPAEPSRRRTRARPAAR